MSGSPFSRPASATGIQWEGLLGRLLLIEPLSYETGVNTVHGEKDAVRADVTVIDANEPPEEHKDTLIFPSVLITQTRSLIGEKVLGRLTQGTPKVGQKPPWKIEEATEQDEKLAVRYLEHRDRQKLSKPAAADDGRAPWE